MCLPVFRKISLFISLSLTALLCACGPRADNTAPAPYDAGARPGIVDHLYGVRTELYAVDPALSAGNMVFRVGYILNATDADANMRAVEVQVTWTNCSGVTTRWRATEDIPADLWVEREALIEGVTADPVEVPSGCLPEGNLILASARIIDARGNYSNTVDNQLTVLVSQGPGG